MKRGGILDGFPAHLLTGGESKHPVVIIDNPGLGYLRLQAIPKCGRQVIVSTDRNSLKKTMDVAPAHEKATSLYVQADPARLPFRDNSVQEIVTYSGNRAESNRRVAGGQTCSQSCDEFSRVLASDGRLLQIAAMSQRTAKQSGHTCVCWSESQIYFMRPSSGKRYYATKEWIPTTWPFKYIQVGLLDSIRIAKDLLIGKLGIRPLFDGVRVIISSKARLRDPIEMWSSSNQVDEGSNYSNDPTQNTFGLFVKAGRNAILLGGSATKPLSNSTLVKFPLNEEDDSTWRHHIKSLDELNSEAAPQVRPLIPEVVDQGILSGQAFWAETYLKGYTASNFWWKPGWRKKTSNLGLQFLIDLHQTTRSPRRLDRRLFDELVGPTVDCLEDRAKEIDPDFNLVDLVEAIWDVFENRRIPLVRTHGDFYLGNLLVSPKGELTGVPDWETSAKQDWPLLDLLHLIAFNRKWLAMNHFGRVVTRKLMMRRFASWERIMIDKYNATLGIDDDLWPGFVAIYWMNRVAQMLRLFDDRWVNRNLIQPIPRIQSALRSQ